MNRLQADNLVAPGIVHGFFGRVGGVSGGIYGGLNCGPGSGDHPLAVAENRRLAAAALGPDIELISLGQVHSATVHPVPLWDVREGDGMVTATPGHALGILTADCAPVLFADPRARVIGAAHAGWKGALGGVLENTIAAMEKLGAARERIQAAIGPCISQANYEVGWEFRDKFLAHGGLRNRKFFLPSGKEGHYLFDLEGYAAHRLAGAGVGSVHLMGICTYPADSGYYSFRRTTHAGEPDYGRQVSAIALTA